VVDRPTIAIINESTCVVDATIKPIVDAIQIQIDRDFVPAWGPKSSAGFHVSGNVGANVTFVGKGQPVPANAWPIGVCDNCAQADALGYHEEDNGIPTGWIGAEDDITYGSSLSVTIDHETLETIADPHIDQIYTIVNPDGTQTQYCVEDSDAVEDDSLGYAINGVLMSDFQFPSWWSNPASPLPGPYDFQKKVTAPLQLLAGGYIGKQTIDANGKPQGWTQVTAQLLVPTYHPGFYKPAHVILPGSRRHRRIMKARKLLQKNA